MDGGTFTISNGGVFGSMMGTPIINPPQSAILGMHAIIDRPVAVRGKVSQCQGLVTEGMSERNLKKSWGGGGWCGEKGQLCDGLASQPR